FSGLRLSIFVVILFFILLVIFKTVDSGESAAGSSVPSFSNVFLILEENHEYTQIIGSSAAPYINSLANQYGLATNFKAISHPSLPNYMELTSGSNQGITTDCSPGSGCSSGAPNIFSELEAAGKTWKAYQEGMSSN